MVEVVFITNGAARHTIVYTCINFAQVLLNFVCEIRKHEGAARDYVA